MNANEVYDVTIIGGGASGLYSAFYSGLRGMKTKIIEYQNELGGKLHAFPEKMIWDVGGQPPIIGEKFMKQLIEQGLTFDPTVVLNTKVVSIQEENQCFVIQDGAGNEHFSKTIIIAIGSGILKPQKLKVDGAEKFELSNLNYTVKSLGRFKDKTVVISGGGNSAIDWANELSQVAKKIYVTCRKEQFKGHEAQVEQLQNGETTCLFNTCISKLIPSENQDQIKCIEVNNTSTGEVSEIEVDEVIVNHGYDIDTSLMKDSNLNIEMEDQYFIKGNSCSETSVPGVYAVGDILKHDGKINLLAGCFQDAVNAVNKAKQYIEPKADQTAMVSSHNDIFKNKNKELIKEMI
ncbi:NAD(P)/FAD-dependent oxidoreductase [Filobacillus milosensis]|uniref:Ferredoxin--NADP reductase n=1 Tax=Filobacillus milosensis TaxID=94137 RepID=A0A4Y8ING1_9BACI|nr:NAD(P)/FAD-dependent oxidoreductase [Filobacillus milosensis]TFB21769.1 NAD(P)/FAD-dependent oxidoreductase [Filobacillus milosensis]